MGSPECHPAGPDPTPSRRGHGTAVWILGILLAGTIAGRADLPTWTEAGDHRWSPLILPAQGQPGFHRLPATSTGIHFTNHLSEIASLTNHIYLNGSGVALGDLDGDGRVDVVLSQLEGPNRAFRNLGQWRFAELDLGPAACPDQYSTGVTLADIDGNGTLDLLVNGIGSGTRLFLNNGQGVLREAMESGLRAGRGAMSMALGDIDGNGTLDLYVANYRTWTMRDSFSLRLSVASVEGRPMVTRVNGRPVSDPDLAGRFTITDQGVPLEHGEVDLLYRNDGTGRFQVVPFTTGAFLDASGQPLSRAPFEWGLGVVFRDINGDGHPDLYVSNDFHSPDRLWFGRGDGTFQEAPPFTLRKTSHFSMSVDVADLNRDGLDDFLIADMLSRRHADRMRQVSGHMPQLHPIGSPEFRPQYVRNMLFVNQGDGEFVELAYSAGVHASEWSWAPVFLDVDLDGFEDLLIPTGFPRDVQDIDVADAIEQIRQQRRLPDLEALKLRKRFPSLALPNVAFRNRGDLTFEDHSQAWNFADVSVAQGMALGDLDGDGDLDVVINCLNEGVLVYRNESIAPRLAVQLRGLPPNTRGIGARVSLHGGAVPLQSQEFQAGGRYLSSDQPLRSFAANTLGLPMSLEVLWPSGLRSLIPGLLPNHLVEVLEPSTDLTSPPAQGRDGRLARPTVNSQPRADAPAARPYPEPGTAVTGRDAPPGRPSHPSSSLPPSNPHFQDLSSLLNHRHLDEPFDDFARQPLLPRRLSQSGPGVAWLDLDGDGLDDLVIGSGRGGSTAFLRNPGGRRPFLPLPNPPPDSNAPSLRDQTGIVGFSSTNAQPHLLIGLSNWEDAQPDAPHLLRFDASPALSTLSLDSFPGGVGPLALGALDGPGPLTLFVGSRVLPARYPEGGGGRLFHWHDGVWHRNPDPDLDHALASAGMVSGALFTDLTGDGTPELVLACEWGPVRIFGRAPDGRWLEQTAAWGLQAWTGWWNGVASADLDADGRLDLIVSNWGTNHRYQPYRAQPLSLYHGDFLGDGRQQTIESFFDPDLGKWVPWVHLGRMAVALPFVRQHWPTYTAYSQAGVDQILGDRFALARELQATHLESTVFLNRGNRFELQALPREAQWSPAFAVVAADFDGDGHEDVFLSQNFFATEPESGRSDDGRGLWLRGDGQGNLAAVPAAHSGLRVYGEQRGAAAADFDNDGRVDLVVTQNGGPTHLFRNTEARPGWRIRLEGPPGNRLGIGTQMRWVFPGNRLGPVREVQAGSGYLSQNSATQILGATEPPQSLWIRWPGGRETNVPIPSEPTEILVRY